MRKTLRNPVFLVCLFLAFTNQVLEKGFGIFLPVVHCYLDDFLCFPIVLTLGLAAYRFQWPVYQLTAWHVWPLVLIYSVYFEWYLPQQSVVYTADVLDVVMYALGAVFFQQFINRSGANFYSARFQNS